MASAVSSVSKAQEDTQAIITALKKGHDELLKATAPKVNPVFFAWAQVDGGAALAKRVGETHEAYPAHGAVDKVTPSKQKSSQGPFNPSGEYPVAAWASENHAAFAAEGPDPDPTSAEHTAAGFKNLVAAKQPPFFAWLRMDEGIDCPGGVRSEAVQTEGALSAAGVRVCASSIDWLFVWGK